MDDQYKFFPKDSWKNEIKSYLPRLSHLISLDQRYQKTNKALWPDKIWPTTEVQGEKLVAFQIAVFANDIFSLSYNVTALVVELWIKGRFFAIPLNTRFVYESWGAIHYAKGLLEKADIENTRRLTNTLLTGSYKAKVQLPWGSESTEQCPSVMEYIRSLEEIEPKAGEIYGLLSSASHPNTIQNVYFSNMGSPISNWDNLLFKKHAHELLDTVLCAHERSHSAMQSETVSILRKSAKILKY